MTDEYCEQYSSMAFYCQKLNYSALAQAQEVEWIFSTFDYINSNIRDRLGIDKVAKIAFIYRLLNLSI